MKRGVAVAAVVGAALVPAAGHANTPVYNSQHQSAAVDDCRFTSWFSAANPVATNGVLTAAADLRCATQHQVELDVYVVDGIDDPTAVAGPPNPLLGVGDGGGGKVVWSRHVVTMGDVQISGQVRVPKAGHIYTIDTIAKFSDACAIFQCDPPPPGAPPAPSAPGAKAPLSDNENASTCLGQHDGTFDVDCQWQFTVLGRAAGNLKLGPTSDMARSEHSDDRLRW